MPVAGRLLVHTSPSAFRYLGFLVRVSLAAGPVLAIAAVICGHFARRSKDEEGRQKELGVALAGLLLGYIFIAYSILAGSVALFYSRAMKDF